MWYIYIMFIKKKKTFKKWKSSASRVFISFYCCLYVYVVFLICLRGQAMWKCIIQHHYIFSIILVSFPTVKGKGSEYMLKCDISVFLFKTLSDTCKILFSLCHYGVLSEERKCKWVMKICYVFSVKQFYTMHF